MARKFFNTNVYKSQKNLIDDILNFLWDDIMSLEVQLRNSKKHFLGGFDYDILTISKKDQN